MNNWNNNLMEFRREIFRGNWGGCVKTLEPLFASISIQALRIGIDHATLSQAKYSRNNAQLAWLAQFSNALFEIIEQGRSVDNLPNLPREMELDYSDKEAGLSNLIIAIKQIWEATRNINQVGNLISHALDDLITADLCHYWSHAHPKEWQLNLLFWAAETASGGTKILPEAIDRESLAKGVKFKLEPEAIGYQAAKWSLIADKLEEIQLSK